MPNHFHLLIREKSDGGITKFMSKLLTAYSMYFNAKNGRTGCLFEGRFKASHADTDEYLKYLFSYIHLNPIKIIDPEWKESGITNRLESKQYLFDYTHSSYQDYLLIKRKESSILNKGAFPQYFSSLSEFERSIDEWLTYKDIQ
jgi:putative transposase